MPKGIQRGDGLWVEGRKTYGPLPSKKTNEQWAAEEAEAAAREKAARKAADEAERAGVREANERFRQRIAELEEKRDVRKRRRE